MTGDFKFEYDIQPFDPSNRIIDTVAEPWIRSIDGRYAWDTDGNMTRNEVNEIQISKSGAVCSYQQSLQQ